MKNCTGFEWENFDFHHNKAGFNNTISIESFLFVFPIIF